MGPPGVSVVYFREGLDFTIPKNENPADILMDVIGGKVRQRSLKSLVPLGVAICSAFLEWGKETWRACAGAGACIWGEWGKVNAACLCCRLHCVDVSGTRALKET
eukprot:363234-Chlamydomonas_euryale.AAC.4